MHAIERLFRLLSALLPHAFRVVIFVLLFVLTPLVNPLPYIIIPVIYLAWIARRTFRVHGAFTMTAILLLSISLTTLVVIAQPLKWGFYSQVVNDLPAKSSTVGQIRESLRGLKIRTWYPEEYLEHKVTLPSTPIRLRELLDTVTEQTGLIHHVGSFCGNGATLAGQWPDVVQGVEPSTEVP
jgi:hypothetical protein